MFRVKYLILIALVLVATACGGGKKEMTDEEYFKETSELMYEFRDTLNELSDSVDIYNADNSEYEQMNEPGQKAYDIFTEEYETLTKIQPVAGWEERHTELTEDIKFFQDFAREVVRTSKDGNAHDLGVQASKFMSHLSSVNSLSKLYLSKSE